jgi:hypothetical protein
MRGQLVAARSFILTSLHLSSTAPLTGERHTSQTALVGLKSLTNLQRIQRCVQGFRIRVAVGGVDEAAPVDPDPVALAVGQDFVLNIQCVPPS